MGKWAQVREAIRGAPGGLKRRLRTAFFTGLILVLPAVLTLYILWLFVRLVVAPLAPLLTYFLSPVVGAGVAPVLATILSVLLTVAGLTAVGLAAGLVGRRLFLRLEGVFSRLSVIRAIYGPVRQLLDLFLRDRLSDGPAILAPVGAGRGGRADRRIPPHHAKPHLRVFPADPPPRPHPPGPLRG